MRTIKHRFTGEEITFLETTAETNGEYLYIEVSLPPFGKGPPMHLHDAFEEEFEVMNGTLTIKHGKNELQLQQGEKLLVPIQDAHTFENKSHEPVTFRVKLSPGVYFEQSARIHYGLMEDGLTKEDGAPTEMAHLALILMMQNTLIKGLPLFVQRALFKFAIRKGIKDNKFEQLQKYIDEPIEDILNNLK